MDGSKSYLQQKFEERLAEAKAEARRKSAGSNGKPPTQVASTSLPTTSIGDKVKQSSPNPSTPVVNKPRAVGAGRVQEPTDLKDNSTSANDHKGGVTLESHACDQITGPVLQHVKQLVHDAPLVSAGAVSMEKQMKVQMKYLPRKLSSSPTNDSNINKKDQLPVDVAAASCLAPRQVAGSKRPAPNDNPTDDEEASNSKRLKVSSSHQLPPSTGQGQGAKKTVRKPAYKGAARPRTVVPTVTQDEQENQRPPSLNNKSHNSGIRLRTRHGRKLPVIYDSDDDFDDESPPAGQHPATESALVDVQVNAVKDNVHKYDAAQKATVASESKPNPSKRKRDEDENDSQNEQPKPQKLQKTDPESDKENQPNEVSKAGHQNGIKEFQHRRQGPPYENYHLMMELVAQKQNEQNERRAGMIYHKPTVPRRRISSLVNNVKIREPAVKLNDSKPVPKKDLTDAEYKACEIEADEAQKTLDALKALPEVKVWTKSGRLTFERNDRVGKTREEKRAITKEDKRLRKLVDDFAEIKKEKEDGQRKAAAAAAAIGGPSQTSKDEKKRTATQTASRPLHHP